MSKPDSRRAGSRTGAKSATRRAEMTPEDRAALARQASEERKAKSNLVLFGAVGGGVLLLLVIIVAASTGGGGAARPVEKKKAVAAPPPAPVEKAKPVNYVRNTGAIMFICGGSDKHDDREVLILQCPGCKAKNAFEVDNEARGYRCTKCKVLHDQAAIVCDLCGRPPRLTTKLKKVLLTSTP